MDNNINSSPNNYTYSFFTILAASMIMWFLVFLLTLVFDVANLLKGNFSTFPDFIEIIIILIVSVFVSYKMKDVSIIKITENSVVQGGRIIEFTDIERLEIIKRWFFSVILIQSKKDSKLQIFVLMPQYLKNCEQLIAILKEKSGMDF